MENRAGVLLAFVMGAMVGYKWPAIRKTLAPFASKVEMEVVKGYLAVKEGISGVSSHLREVADEVSTRARSSRPRKVSDKVAAGAKS